MSKITYLTGDVLKPQCEGQCLIIHVVSNAYVMGAGVAGKIAAKWPSVKERFLWAKPALGRVQFCHVGIVRQAEGTQWHREQPDDKETIVIANMVAQHGLKSAKNPHPIRYDALEQCLGQVNVYAKMHKRPVHMPMIGTLRAGGDWREIEPIIERVLTVPVFVYRFVG